MRIRSASQFRPDKTIVQHKSSTRGLSKSLGFYLAGAVCLMLGGIANAAPNPNFSVTVNTGVSSPNNDTVYPGEATSLRITFSNNSTVDGLTNVSFNQPLPTGATGGLRVNGTATVSGPGCVGGLVTSTPGAAGLSLSGLTVPPKVQGVDNSGECYLDIPVVAWSNDGGSSTHAYNLPAGSVTSNEGENASGGPQGITVRQVARPTFTKGFPTGAATLIQGGASQTLRITVNNPNPHGALSNFAFEDIFPTNNGGVGGAIIEPDGALATAVCTPAAGSTAPAINLTQGPVARVTVSKGTIAAGGNCVIEVSVRARHTGVTYQSALTNTILASTFTSDEGLRPATNATSGITSRSPLAVSKAFAHSPIAGGVASTFTITLSNNGTTSLPVQSFTDNPISAVPYVGKLQIQPGGVVNSCAGGTQSISGDQNGFTVGGFAIPAGGTCVLTVTFIGESRDDNLPSAYQNVIPAGAVTITGQPNIISQGVTASVTVADRLRILKTQSPTNVTPGDPVKYSITVQNFSDTALTNVTVADNLQNGSTLLTGPSFPVELTSACGAPGLNGRVQGDADLMFTIPTVPPRTAVQTPGSCTISFWAMIDPASEAATHNQIGICAVRIDGSATACNQEASPQTTVPHQAAISLLKRFNNVSTANAFEGSVVRMQLVIYSLSNNPLTSIALDDTMPLPLGGTTLQQLRIASPANLTNSCGGTVSVEATSISLNDGILPGKNPADNNPTTCSIEVNVVGSAGDYNNTATVAAQQTNADGSVTNVDTQASARLIYQDALTASKGFSPAQVGSGGLSTLRIRIGNVAPTLPITGLRILDNLPAGMTVANPSNAYTTCTGSPIINAVSGASVVGIERVVVNPGTTCDLLVDVVATGDTDWTNVIAPGQITADNGLLNRTDVSATLTYVPAEIPAISKAITPGSVVPGHSSLLTVTITNTNQALTGVKLTDYFTVDGLAGSALNGMLIADVPQATTTCPGGVVTATPGARSLSLSLASIAPGEVCTFSARVTSKRVGTISNLIPESSLVSDQGATNSTSFATSTLSTTSNVGVSKEFKPKVVNPGEVSRLRISFFNPLSQALLNFGILDEFPAGLEVATDPNAYSTCGGGVSVTWPNNNSVRLSGGTLAAAVGEVPASCYLEINVIANDADRYVNSIPGNALTVDNVPVPHPPTEGVLEVREPLIINKAIDDKTLDENDPSGFVTGEATRLPSVPATLKIRLENTDNRDLTQLTFTDNLPDGLVLSTTPDPQWSCATGTVHATPAGRTITLAGAILPAGTACFVTVNVSSNTAGVYTNSIPAKSVTTYEGVTNEEPTEARLNVTEPGAVTKQFEPPVVAPNVPSRLTITIANPNQANMVLSAALIDTLPTEPSQMRVAGTPNVVTTCPGGVGIVNVSNITRVQINSGAVIPEGGCDVEVDVVATELGNYENFIPAGALQTNFGPNEEPAESPLLISTLGYISGKVFIDREPVPDGIWYPGRSTAIAGSTIELREGAACSGNLIATTTTDVSGNYLFSELPAGTYSVCQIEQPGGTLNSITTEGVIREYNGAGGTVGTASNPQSGTPTSQIVGIVLSSNGNADEVGGSPQNNFSEIQPASISGWVYHDRNDDGVKGPGEEGIANVLITLTDANGDVVGTTRTAPDGSWSFENLRPGEYTVTESHPSGWDDGQDTAGSKGGDASVNDVISSIVLVSGDKAINYNFGELLPTALSLSATAVCDNNLPYVDYVISSIQPFDSSAPLFNIQWLTSADRIAEQLTDQPVQGRLLWPGVEIDDDNNVIAYPGWVKVNDKWTQVSDDRRPDMTIRAYSPDATAVVTYLRSNSRCAPQPTGTFTPPAQAPTTSVWGLIFLSLTLMSGAWYHQRRRLRVRS